VPVQTDVFSASQLGQQLQEQGQDETYG